MSKAALLPRHAVLSLDLPLTDGGRFVLGAIGKSCPARGESARAL